MLYRIRLIALGLLVGAALGFALVAGFGVRSYTIPTGSMFPQIHIGERVVATARGVGPVRRGDVITFTPRRQWRQVCGDVHSPHEYLKRVVGIPGDRVFITYATISRRGDPLLHPGGPLATHRWPLPNPMSPRSVGTRALPEGTPTLVLMVDPAGPGRARPLVIDGAMTPTRVQRFARVPAGHYLVMGDNRPGSCDSRDWQAAGHDPFVPADAVSARMIVG